MLIISYKFQERSEGADEILIWIPQTSVAIGSTIFFISVFHQFILTIKKGLNDRNTFNNFLYQCFAIFFRDLEFGLR